MHGDETKGVRLLGYRIVGARTGKVYAQGSRSECFRKLQKEFPSSLEHQRFKKGIHIKQIYPEELRILKAIS